MIVQVDIESAPRSQHGGKPLSPFGFYRIMVGPFPGDDDLPSYWMYNGTWHWRRAPNLNPPKPWCL